VEFPVTLPAFVIGGIPLIAIILMLVEEIKAWGLQGKILRVVSMLIGLFFAVAYQLAVEMPVTFMAWLVVIAVGLLYGIAASGTYDFIDRRLPSKVP
jgi:hypothetical protein